MKRLFSAKERAETWRRLWFFLAKSEKELGLDISDEAITQMKEHIEMTDKDFEVAAAEEKKVNIPKEKLPVQSSFGGCEIYF